MKCDILECETVLSKINPIKQRIDGILIQVLNTGKAYLICNKCAKKLGLIM